jgi:hypothetical protein
LLKLAFKTEKQFTSTLNRSPVYLAKNSKFTFVFLPLNSMQLFLQVFKGYFRQSHKKVSSKH